MAGLDKHRKLLTPMQGLILVVVGIAAYCWYNDIDILYHLGHFREGFRNLFDF